MSGYREVVDRFNDRELCLTLFIKYCQEKRREVENRIRRGNQFCFRFFGMLASDALFEECCTMFLYSETDLVLLSVCSSWGTISFPSIHAC